MRINGKGAIDKFIIIHIRSYQPQLKTEKVDLREIDLNMTFVSYITLRLDIKSFFILIDY